MFTQQGRPLLHAPNALLLLLYFSSNYYAISLNSDYNSLLANINFFIKRNYGIHFKADVFVFLLVYLFVLRLFKFTLANSALYATINNNSLSSNYTERFQQIYKQVQIFCNLTQYQRYILVLFNIKSSTLNYAED